MRCPNSLRTVKTASRVAGETRQQEQNYVTAQAQLKQANADLQKLQGEMENRPP